ncbi:MAG: bile acid:sodium symporter family protein [Marivibrio sp.]|uniref:bile acid:sodium symporter family protein n=1 Tax=Marivibrio sp. TaxID=2039719 RepID=UPI0032EB1644
MDDSSLITQLFLPAALAFIMVTVGLELSLADFRRVVTQPKAALVGAACQVLLLPAVAFALVSAVDMAPALAVGVMILAACPGGVTSNLLTYLARADTALSVSLTAAISLLSVVTLPLIVGLALAHFTAANEGPEIAVARTVIGVFTITTVPVLIGMAVKWRFPDAARRMDRIGRPAASVLFVVIVAGAIWSERANVAAYFVQAGPVALALNLCMLGLAAAIARAAALAPAQRAAITLECGLQNGTLAIFVALTLLGSREMMIPGAIYSLIMFPTALAYLLIARRVRGRAHGA